MRALARYSGTAVALLLLGFFVYRQDVAHFGTFDFTATNLWAGLAGSLVLYTLVILMGAFGWRLLLNAFDERPAYWTAERQLLLSQIGKYVPGNLAHYLGRAALALKSGATGTAVAAALMTETVLTVLGGLLVAALCIWLAAADTRQLLDLVPENAPTGWLVLAIIVFFIALVAAAFVSGRKRIANLPAIRLRPLCGAALIYAVSFVILGVTLHLIAQSLSPAAAAPPLALSIAVFALAWTVGLVTPGAPGGLGVRDAIMTLGLAPVIGAPEALSVAALHRAISVAGDVVAFAIGVCLPTRSGP